MRLVAMVLILLAMPILYAVATETSDHSANAMMQGNRPMPHLAAFTTSP